MNLLIIFLFAGAILLITVAAIVKRENSVSCSYVSDYVHGRFGWLTTLNFIFRGNGGFLLLFDRYKLFSDNVLGIVIIILLIIWSISSIMLAIFPNNVDSKITTTGKIHSIFATSTVLITFILILVYATFEFTYLSTLFLLCNDLIFITLILGIFLLVFGNANYKGIYQRMIIYSELVWFVVLATYKFGQ